ncbi:MAG: Peptidoglycan-binding domain 1 protein [Chthoniobacteraceae bacterium]|nr:Peptidoglycan-binding domain 1 protein [Chthoniobacteraceae bacterium]
MMKKIVNLALLSFLISSAGRADDLTRNAQTELKTQGFYYGEIDGTLSTETSASIKRFQIRNGLDVTGTLTEKTLESLGLSKVETPRTPPVTQVTPPPIVQEERRPRVEDDRRFLQREEGLPPRPEAPRIAPPRPEPSSGYEEVFARTPFASAPPEIQRSTVKRAQSLLSKQGLFRERVDGMPSPALEEALLTYQRHTRLPLTGRLDLDTLSIMRLLPGRGGPPLQPFNEGGEQQRPPQKVYRGVWVR